MKLSRYILALACAIICAPAPAQTLVIGAANDATSMDPQFTRAASNQNFVNHIYERLIEPGKDGKTTPYLAERWQNLDPKTWMVYLRKGVKFHNGSPFTADDVVFSIERAPKVPNSPASFAAAVAEVDKMEIVDSHTIKFTTKTPSPRFIEDVGYVHILDKETSQGMATADFNSGKAAIGTGPYKFVSWTPGDKLELVRNEDYWGPKPAYQRVTLRFIGNNAARLAALRSGQVDLIDQVPVLDVKSLEKDPNFRVTSAATYRIIYLALNQNADAPLLTDLNGKPLPKNPLQDKRVRQAMSLMIDRQAITDRLLQGAGQPANQFVNDQSFGFDPKLPAIKPDVKRAKQLLAEAGYPNGFGITVHGSNDRYPQDGELVQALGQMFSRGGLKVNGVVALPYTVYAKEAVDNKYAAFTFSYGNATAESLRGLLATLHTRLKGDVGTLNRFGYSNPKVDEAIDGAASEFNAQKQEQYLQEAAALVYDDAAFLPLYFQRLYWISKKGVDFDAWSDERSFAWRAKPAK
ncbi:Heme-binding protein A precursor [Pigmentiphaga humi]|uniref:Heme-binding protein A n=1 Tax=Pigmentiphaga humi TaxID=2478468 RepID=A0A3P4B5Z9_9BURK|nr:ABC transporter substrate-binding protein [Pigmentiphaga humi]VCU70946.1 Heme-binding protein A precursor [Pigmentiphaga humi]